MIPIAGSAYTFTYATLEELIAWIIGVACLGWNDARWYGIHLAAIAALSAATAWAWRTLSKQAPNKEGDAQ